MYRRITILLAILLLGLASSTAAWASGDSDEGGGGPGTEDAGQNFFRDDYAVDVDPATGSFSSTIEIEVPPFRGLEPNLSLTYSSSAGNGFVGVGWRLGGFSYIERATPGRGAPNYLSSDIYVLDGQELIPSCSDMGGDYCTQIQNFRKIEKVSDTWEITDPDGTKTTYKALLKVTSPTTTFRWAIDTVQDTNGNELEYQYSSNCSTGPNDCYPTKIIYRDSSGAIGIEIQFDDKDRPGSVDDDITFATGRDIRTMGRVLDDIEIWVGGDLSRRYVMKYDQSTNGGRSLLDTVERQGTDGNSGNSLPDIVITYEDGASGSFSRFQETQTLAISGEFLSGDFNGDGRSDLFYIPPGTPSTVTTFLSVGDGNFTSTTTSVSGYAPVNAGSWVQGDFDGDGRSDLAHAYKVAGAGNSELYIWYSNGDGTFNRDETTPLGSGIPSNKGLGRWIAGDWNGDGKTDLAHVSSQTNKLHIWHSDGGFTWVVTQIDPGVGQAHQGWWLPIDLNGDGSTDIAHLHGGVLHSYRSSGNFNFVHTQPSTAGYPQYIQGGKWRAGDFNGDGNTDLLHVTATNGAIYIWYSLGGSGFSWAPLTIPSGYPATLGGWWFPIELNGDGRTDLYHVATNNTLRLWQSKGAPGSFSNTTITQPGGYPGPLYAISNMRWQSGDFNGDGRDDLSHILVNNRIWTWFATGQDDNRLSTFENRTGGVTSVTYQASTEWDNQFLPVGMVMHTVDTITTDDGRGNTHPISYLYEDGLWSSRERCFLGFRRILKILDSDNNYEETIIRQTDNCTNRPEEIYQRHSNDLTYDSNDGIFSYSLITYDEEVANPPYYALESDRHSYECEFTGNLSNCRDVRTETFYDQYANVTRFVEHGDTSVATDQRTTIRNYAYNTSDFIVGLVGRETLYDDVTVDGTGANLVARTEFVYDDLAAYTDPPTKGNLTKQRAWEDWAGDALPGIFRETVFGYDTYGNLTSETDPNSNETTTVYDTTYRLFPESICPPLIPCRTQSWDFRRGVIDDEWDTNSVLTDHSYDIHGRLTSTLHPDGTTTDFDYENEGNPSNQHVQIHEPDHTADGLWRDVFIDGFGRTWKVEREGGERQLTTYHENSERISSKSLWYDPGPESARYRDYHYDGAKRLESVDEPSGASYSITYDIGFSTRTDTLNKQRVNWTDAYGQVDQIDEIIVTPSPDTYSTEFEYDELGNLTRVENHESKVATFSFDTLSQKREACDFNLGCWTFGYDAGGRMTSQTDAVGQVTTTTYDALDRLKTKLNDEGKLTTWYYDEDSLVHGFSQGRLTRIVYPEGNESYKWNNMGLQESITRCVGTDCRLVQQTFEAVRLKNLTYPDGEVVVYSYDTDGHMASVLGTNGASSDDDYVTSMSYNARDQLETMVFANGVTTTLLYDNPYDALSDFTAVDDTEGTAYQAHYVYNDAIQVTSITSTTHPKLSVALGYDDLYRLKTVTGGQTQSFTYTPIGNMWTNSAVGTYVYGDPSKPHAVTKAGNKDYQYDGNGNLTSVTEPSPDCIAVDRLLNWDSENQLTWVSNGSETTSYQYNSNGSRIRKLGPSGTTHYFGKVAEVQDPDGTPSLVKYYYAGDILISRQEGASKRFYHQDHLDSIRAMSDETGAQAVRYEYAAFGEEIEKVGGDENSRSFGAHWRDDESGLLYMGARYHDPVLGRFTQPDQMVPGPGDPQSWNRYSFVRNNPFNRIDPTGRIDTAADLADKIDEGLESVSGSLSDAVLDSGNPVLAAGASVAQTGIDLLSGAVDTLRLGEGAAQGGVRGFGTDILRAAGVVGGIGASVRAAKAGLRATRGPLTSAYRYVGPGEARIIGKTGVVPNTTRLGQPKNVSLTPQEFRSASQVEEALAVGRFDPRGPGVAPTHGVQVDLRGAPLSYGGTGATGAGGIEVQTPAAVRALRIFELEP